MAINNEKNPQTDQTLSLALIRLLQGPVYHDQRLIWETILTRKSSIEDYYAKIGLSLCLDEVEGYAFLRSTFSGPQEKDENGEMEADFLSSLPSHHSDTFTLPRLTRRVHLSYDLTLLLVILRENLEQFDVESGDNHRPILSQKDIYDLLFPFFPSSTDQTKQVRRFDNLIEKAKDMQILCELGLGTSGNAGAGREKQFEVKRIIKALLEASKLEKVKQYLLKERNNPGEENGTDTDDEKIHEEMRRRSTHEQ